MKTLLPLAVIILLLSFPGFAQEHPLPRSITVTGDAEVKVVPDEVDLTFGIQTSNKDLDAAKAENDKRVKDVMKLAKSFGIEAEQIQTDRLSIQPRYETRKEQQVFVEYVVANTIVVTLKDISKFEELLSGALKAGVNYVQGIDFRTTELRKHRDQARAMAIKAAKEKAIALAKELGQTIGKPLSISEDPPRIPWGTRNVMQVQRNDSLPEGDGSGDSATLALGRISVSARVTVVFELEQSK